MKRILFSFLFTVILFSLKAQNSFPFSCNRDTTLDCTQNCITLTALIPNVKSSTTSYTVNPMAGPGGCFKPYIDPATPGSATSLDDDDTYSTIISIPFNFPFFEGVYRKLVVSTNGIVSFDSTLAGLFSDYGILNSGGSLSATAGTPQNLPSSLYDKAVIMGPFHDIDPFYTTSPTQRINYTVIGSAPHRKWILSFYKIPLFNTACQNLIQNTHQIVLYEGLGIAEVFVFSKQICTSWNEGRAMIGMQNMARNSAVMVPGRRASDAPWGTVNMNEAYRFIPSSGQPLYKRVELFDLSGNLVSTGDTTGSSNGNLQVSFPNVCTSASTTLLVKSTYKKFDDPTVEVYGIDTINIIRTTNMPAVTVVTTPASCLPASTGTVTATSPVGTNYVYSIDGINFQSSPVFNAVVGTYTITARDTTGCTATSSPAVINSLTTLTATADSVNTACAGSATGKIIVTATLGVPPYTYSLNNSGTFQSSNTFNNLIAGTYSIRVKDNAGCVYIISIKVINGPGISTNAVSTNSFCPGSPSGIITVTPPVNGLAPYTYSKDNLPYVSNNVFPGLPGGTSYQITVKDANGCRFSFEQDVNNGPGITATADSFNTGCNGLSNGKIIIRSVSGVAPYTFSVDGGPNQTNDTLYNLAAGTHNITVTDANSCTYTFQKKVINGTGVTASYRGFPTSCAGAANGYVVFKPNLTSGPGPYQYSVDSGVTYVSTDTIRNLAAGITYRGVVKDANGCVYRLNILISAGAGITATATTLKSACPGVASGKIIVKPLTGTRPYKYSLDGGLTYYTNSDTIPNLASNTYSVLVVDSNGCTVTVNNVTVRDSTGVSAVTNTVKSACAGIATGKILVTATAGTSPFKYSLDGGVTTQLGSSFSNLASNTYAVTVIDSYGCTVTVSAVVGDSVGVTARVNTMKSACAGAATGKIFVTPTLGTSPFKYSLDGGVTTQTNAVFSNLASNTYAVTIIDSNGCRATVSAVVGDSVGVTARVSTIKSACAAAATGQIIVTPILGTSPFKYSLDGGVTTQTNNTFSSLAANTYTVTIIDSNNCTATVSAVIGDSTGATGTARIVQSACVTASTGKIIVVPGIGTSPFRYSLDAGGFQSNDTFPNLAANTYMVNILDANNCPFSFNTTVGNLPVIPPSVRSLNAACSGASTGTIIITPNVGTGSSPFQYSIDNGGTYPYTDTIRNLAANTYNLAIKDANSCVITFTGVVRNNPGVIINTVIDKASCAIIPNGKITINPIAGIAPFSYSLNYGTPQVSNQFPNLFSGSYTITIKDSALCSLDTVIVVGNAARVVLDSVTIVRPACNGFSDGTIKVYPRLGVPPYQYAMNSGAYQTSNVFNNVAASVVSDTLHIMDNSGCVKDTIITITEPTVLTIGTASVPATCTGLPDGKITVTGNGGTTPYLYTMDAAVSGNFKNTPEFYLVKGSYVFGIKDAKGCIVAKADSVLLHDTMRLELGRDTTICAESNIILTPLTNAQTSVFKWWPKAGLSDSTIKNPSASPADTTKYYMKATWGICERLDSMTINILLRPVPNAGNDTAVCYNTSGRLYGSIGKVSGPVTYLWTPSAFLSRTDTTFTEVNADTSGVYPYTLTVKDQYGCNFSTSDQVVFTMLPIPVAFAGNDTTAVLGVPHQLLATGGATYSWDWATNSGTSFGASLNYTNIPNPLATITQETKFVVTVRDIAGCPDTDTVLVTPYVGPAVYLPSAFSPDGNIAQNKTFKPKQVGMRSLDHFTIFNRYGQVVFETSNWEKGWDGTFKGQRQNLGAYVWTLRSTAGNGKVFELKGTVMLIR